MRFQLGERRIECRTDNYFIAETAVVIGSVVLGDNASIWYNTVVRGDNDLIVIGDNTNIQDGSILHTDAGIQLRIGNNVTVGHKAMLHGCEIGDNTLIGINAVVLNNAKIGRNCIIGANALVPEGKVIPDNSMVLGSPGKVVKDVTEQQTQMLSFMAAHYVENAKRYREQLVRDDG